jgi:hypothetical protein
MILMLAGRRFSLIESPTKCPPSMSTAVMADDDTPLFWWHQQSRARFASAVVSLTMLLLLLCCLASRMPVTVIVVWAYHVIVVLWLSTLQVFWQIIKLVSNSHSLNSQQKKKIYSKKSPTKNDALQDYWLQTQLRYPRL